MTEPLATRHATKAGRACAAIACAALVGGAGLAAPSWAAAAPAPPAQLSITLTDGLTQVHSNTDVDYATKVTNSGSSAVTAELVLSTPTYVAITKAAGAKVAGHTATWRITVRAGQSVSKPASAHIGTIAKGDYRVTTLASVYRGKTTTGVPLIRTAVANTIAGVTDPARTVKPATAPHVRSKGSSDTNWLLVAGVPGLAVVLLAIAAVLWWRRRRTASDLSSPSDNDVDPVAQPFTPTDEATEPPVRHASAGVGRHHADD